MGIKKSIKKGVPFWGKMCVGFVCAAVAMSFAADCTVQLRAAGQSSIASLEAKAKQLAADNEKRQKEIEDLDSDINENKDAMDLVSSQIDGVNEEIDTYSALITAKQEAIDQKYVDIANVEKTISNKEKEIGDKQIEIGELEEENTRNLERFGKLARYMYMNNTGSQLPILNGSDDWYDYFVYSDVVKNISGQNYDFMKSLQASITKQENMITELNGQIESLETEKSELEEQKSEYETEAQGLADEKNQLEQYATEKQNYMYGLAAENETLKSKINGLTEEIKTASAEMDAINDEIEELIRQAQQSSGEGSGDNYDYSGDGLRWPLPVQYHWISTYFGYDAWRNGMHRGIDIGDGGIAGEGILAAQSGTVITVSNTCPHNYGKNYSCGCGGGYGNYIIIDHGGGLSTLYAHCQKIYVSKGQQINKGDTIGAVGTTGWSTGFHLHFEVRENGVAVNPFNYVSYE